MRKPDQWLTRHILTSCVAPERACEMELELAGIALVLTIFLDLTIVTEASRSFALTARPMPVKHGRMDAWR